MSPYRSLHWLATAMLMCLQGGLQAADYEIVLENNLLTIADRAGNGDTLTVSEPGAGEISFAAPGRSFQINGGPELMVNSGPLALTGVTQITVTLAAGADILDIGSFATPLPSLNVSGGDGADVVNFLGDVTWLQDRDLIVNLMGESGQGPGLIKVAPGANLAWSGTGGIQWACSGQMELAAGASLDVVDGAIRLRANLQTPSVPGNFIGISLSGAALRCSGAGEISLSGQGGNTGDFNAGISLQDGALVRGGPTGSVMLVGQGGGSPGQTGYGIFVSGVGTKIESLGGSVALTGVGGGSGAGGYNTGVQIQGGGQLNVLGNGALEVRGTGGLGTGITNLGISLAGAGTGIFTADGNIVLVAMGGGGGSGNFGLNVQGGAVGRAGGAGTFSILGTGGTGSARSQVGINLADPGTLVTTEGGNLTLEGLGGGAGGSDSAHGVLIQNGAVVRPGSHGDVTVLARGGMGSGTTNLGIFLSGPGSAITSSGGNVVVTGVGGGVGTSTNNYGINLNEGGVVTAGGSGTVTLHGHGGGSNGTGNFGIFMVTGAHTQVTSAGGDIAVYGTAGSQSPAGNARGVQLQTGPVIAGVGPANVTVHGQGGGAGGGSNYGLRLVAGVGITAEQGAISLAASAGFAGSVAFSLSNVSVVGSKVQTSGTAPISIAADSMDISSSGVAINAGNGTGRVTIRPRTAGAGVLLGSGNFATPGVLELTDSELDQVTAASLILGDSTSGVIQQSAALTSASPLTFRTAHAFSPTLGGVELTTSLFTLPPGQRIHFTLSGYTPDTQHTQLNLSGGLLLDQAVLQLSGPLSSVAPGTSILLVKNDGTDAIQGTFAQLPEGATRPLNGTLYRITYVGGDGNDVALLSIPLPPPPVLLAASISPPAPGEVGRRVQLTLQATTARAYAPFVLEASSDLVRWLPLAEQAATADGEVAFDHYDPSGHDRFFYRATLKLESP